MEEIERQGAELSYLMVYPDEYDQSKEYPLVILLHGYGASMYDLASLAPAIHRQGYVYALPNGPIEVEFGPGEYGHSWRPPRGSSSPVDPALIEAMVDRFFDEVMQEHRVPRGRALLLGFSQGGGMTYRCGLRRADLFAGLVALGTGFPEDMKANLPEQRFLPVFIGHGMFDNIERAQQAQAFLSAAGYPITYHEYPIGHEITQHVLDDLVPWVHDVLPPL